MQTCDGQPKAVSASPAPPSASHASSCSVLRRLAPLSRFAPTRRRVTHTHSCIALRLARIHKRRDERTQRMALRPNAPRQKVRPVFAKATPHASFVLHFPPACCPAQPAMRVRAGTSLAAQRIRPLAAPQPAATLCPTVPSRVEAQARAEPSAGSQGPVLNQVATQPGCRDARPAGLAECEHMAVDGGRRAPTTT